MAQVNNYSRGKTSAASELENLLGTEKWFEDMTWNATGPQTRTTGLKAKCRWVKNDSGTTLTARQTVKYKAGYWGTRVGSLADVAEKADGIVDEFVGTVTDGKHFWLVVEGITEAISDGNSTLVQGDVLITIGSSSGKVRKQDPTVGTSAIMVGINSRVGVVAQSTATAVDATAIRIYIEGNTH